MDERVPLLLLCVMHGIWADVVVMKDVTLGFGQALDKCREEVCNNNNILYISVPSMGLQPVTFVMLTD